MNTPRAFAIQFAMCAWLLTAPAMAQPDSPTAASPGAAATAREPVEGFDAQVWRTWRDEGGGARVVLFSTTFCAHCPALVEALADRMDRDGVRAELHVVIMDREPDERHRALYRRAKALHVFDDNPSRIRHAVDPSWRGGTPFVALLSGEGAKPALSLGAPGESAWRDWMATQSGRNQTPKRKS